MIFDAVTYVILILAAYRITRFMVNDSLFGFGPASESRFSVKVDRFAYFSGTDEEVINGERLDGEGRSWPREKIGDLLTCTWCLGFWISAAVYLAFVFSTNSWDLAEPMVHGISIFAVAGGQGYLNSRLNA